MRVLYATVALLLVLSIGVLGRGSSNSRSRGRFTYFKRSGSAYKKIVASGFPISGLERYRLRFSGTKHYKEAPPVCFTTDVSILNYTSPILPGGFFVCPYFETDSPQSTYCCGPTTAERCCGFWSDIGRVAGAVTGMLLAVGLLLFFIYFVYHCTHEDKTTSSNSAALTEIDVNKTDRPGEENEQVPSSTSEDSAGSVHLHSAEDEPSKTDAKLEDSVTSPPSPPPPPPPPVAS